jgi:lipopolysaccharide transport system permease protein
MRTDSPSLPTVVIQARSGWANFGIRELITYRELGLFLVWRDLKVRYRQTAFGAAWAVIQPLGLMVVFTLFLGRASGIAPGGVPYPLFAYTGLVPWTLISASLLAASMSLVDATNLVQKVYFPRLLLPISAAAAHLLDFMIAMALLVALAKWFGVSLRFTAIWVLPLTGLAVVVALGIGIWFAAINVRYRDVRYALPFLVQLLLLGSPIAYSLAAIPSSLHGLVLLNPITGVVEGFRWAILGIGDAPVVAVLISTVVATLLLVSGTLYFRHTERTFADVI